MVAEPPSVDMALRFEVILWSCDTTVVLSRLHAVRNSQTESVMERSSLELCISGCRQLLRATSLLYEDHLRNP